MIQAMILFNELGLSTEEDIFLQKGLNRLDTMKQIGERARMHAPAGTLFLMNHADMLTEGGESNRMDLGKRRFEMVLSCARELGKEGIIDGIGFQLHDVVGLKIDEAVASERLAATISEGFVAIPTEMDMIQIKNVQGTSDPREITRIRSETQAERWLFWIKLFHGIGKCRSFNFFGLNPSNSWYTVDEYNRQHPDHNATILTDDYQETLAAKEIRKFFASLPPKNRLKYKN